MQILKKERIEKNMLGDNVLTMIKCLGDMFSQDIVRQEMIKTIELCICSFITKRKYTMDKNIAVHVIICFLLN